MAAYFLEAGHEVIVVDNLLCGYKEAATPRIRFIESDINDLANVLSKTDGYRGSSPPGCPCCRR